jgi:shikimate kinase
VNKSGSNIYLIGPMGSGKTTIGQRVAKRLEMEFIDCDRNLEKQTGASVNLIFDVEGESGFRTRESNMLKELTSRHNVLVATGGGTVLKEENRELLKRSGLVVYLQTSVGQQLHRLRLDRTRPLLQEGDRRQKLTRLAAARNPVYEELADLVFPSRNRGPEITARHLTEAILSYWEQTSSANRGIGQDSPSHGFR